MTDKFFDNNKYVSVWKWKNNKWVVYLPGQDTSTYANEKGFDILSSINPGEGFWVNNLLSKQVLIAGTPVEDNLTMIQGWNLMGLKSNQTKSITALISGNETKIISIWKWVDKWAVCILGDEDSGLGYATSKGFQFLEEINPGEGFWVNYNEEMTLE